MIQSVLIFVLGFLSALFLALLLLPAVWRRAVRLTTDSIERAMPVSLEEVRASQDQLRAKQAVELRRVEIERDQALKRAAEFSVDANRHRGSQERLSAERNELEERAKRAEQGTEIARTELRARDQLVAQFASKTKEAEEALSARIDELGRLGRLYEEATLASTARQVEVVALEGEIERLKGQLNELRRERASVAKNVEQPVPGPVEAMAGQRSVDLTRRLDKAIADLSDRNEKIALRDREIADLRKQAASHGDNDLRVVDLQRDNLRMASELASLSAPVGGDAALRETMHDLAAKVVGMVARLDGQAEPIDKALSLESGKPAGQTNIVSLAERIRKGRASPT